ncbi:bifunctional DNA-formamidopyrimidine glycosylase/DNA-(apurinic or apyrimidinic site) lyase [Nocardiopsis coralliicola]
MPELPEVEVVRGGLERWIVGRPFGAAEVLHPRSIRRYAPGAADFAARISGRTASGADRRGKYLWLTLDSGDALLAHLGMSGQLLVQPAERAAERHLRVRIGVPGDGSELRFVDQRTFGHLMVAPLVPGRGGGTVPEPVAHIAPDPLDPVFDDAGFAAALRRRRTEVKRALLDQSLISGIGNIYADEALWRARLHGTRSASGLGAGQVADLLGHVRAVLRASLAEGGTTFDGLYVNVNGESGYFARGLDAYGRADEPCGRCGTPIRRESFMNRSSFSCPRCQPRPRTRSAPPPVRRV